MGTQDVRAGLDGPEMRAFMQHLLADLRALETMVESGQLALDKRRIGAEQELFLIDDAWRPASISEVLVDKLNGERPPEQTEDAGRRERPETSEARREEIRAQRAARHDRRLSQAAVLWRSPA